MYLEAPNLFGLDCNVCRKYYVSGCEVLKDSKGFPIERGKDVPVNCKLCKKFDTLTNTAWKGFTAKNEYVFKCFLMAHYFGTLPRDGGVDNQLPEILDTFIVLEEMFVKYKEVSDMEFQAKLFGLMGNKYGR